MDNKKLIEKLDQIMEKENFCDMIEELLAFKKEYKKTKFYKITKIPLQKFFTMYKQFKGIDLKKIFNSANDSFKDLKGSEFLRIVQEIIDENQSKMDETLEKAKEYDLGALFSTFIKK